MSDDSEKPKSDLVDKLKAARLRMEGGGTLSQLEQDEIDFMNAKIALLCAQHAKSIPLTMQSLTEMLLSAIAHRSTDEKDFRKNVYNFMKDYFFPQSDKIGAIIMERKQEQKTEDIVEKLKNLYKKAEGVNPSDLLQGGVVLSGTPEELVAQLNNLMNPVDDCPCPKCVERRKREEIEKNIPNPNTKH